MYNESKDLEHRSLLINESEEKVLCVLHKRNVMMVINMIKDNVPILNSQSFVLFSISFDFPACLHQDLPTVTNGVFNCSNAKCTVVCNEGFDVRQSETTVYTCDDGTWTPPPADRLNCESMYPILSICN